ncbi:MAG: hypothetical protein VYA27_13370 [Verrucomicrobiota bacterium]|nr:hypothetical protein [Verrucomicrobiota bacterium]MEE2735003.1 hypothetical protein [Verrucomicrobiota bacterium]
MKVLALLCLIPLCLSLSSCALANKLIQAPVRLLQAGVRTVSDVGDPTPPATAEATRAHGVALKNTEAGLR